MEPASTSPEAFSEELRSAAEFWECISGYNAPPMSDSTLARSSAGNTHFWRKLLHRLLVVLVFCFGGGEVGCCSLSLYFLGGGERTKAPTNWCERSKRLIQGASAGLIEGLYGSERDLGYQQ